LHRCGADLSVRASSDFESKSGLRAAPFFFALYTSFLREPSSIDRAKFWSHPALRMSIMRAACPVHRFFRFSLCFKVPPSEFFFFLTLFLSLQMIAPFLVQRYFFFTLGSSVDPEHVTQLRLLSSFFKVSRVRVASRGRFSSEMRTV